jgi:hypothetical protein
LCVIQIEGFMRTSGPQATCHDLQFDRRRSPD